MTPSAAHEAESNTPKSLDVGSAPKPATRAEYDRYQDLAKRWLELRLISGRSSQEERWLNKCMKDIKGLEATIDFDKGEIESIWRLELSRKNSKKNLLGTQIIRP